MNTFAGIGAPKNTPLDVVDRLNKEVNAGLADPSIGEKYGDEFGVTPFPSSPGELGKQMTRANVEMVQGGGLQRHHAVIL